MTRSERINILCREMWSWYASHKRMLPWRDITEKNLDRKAYLVLVSEVMLQQTQVSRVTGLYKEFIRIFPHAEALSKASNRDVLLAWRGLGYNNRALRLRDAARALTFNRGHHFPREMNELQMLPGVGHYTAAAVRNFAFGIPTPCMDVNIRRILHRFFVGPEYADGTWKKGDRYLLQLSQEVLTEALKGEETAADWHAALMDFGSLVCTKNAPKWELFSSGMKSICKAYGKKINRTSVPNPSIFTKKEPGRLMAGRFVPNRIFRGKIVEALRDAKTKLTLEELGWEAIADWPVLSESNGAMEDHLMWMAELMEGLKKDRMVQEIRGKFVLAD